MKKFKMLIALLVVTAAVSGTSWAQSASDQNLKEALAKPKQATQKHVKMAHHQHERVKTQLDNVKTDIKK